MYVHIHLHLHIHIHIHTHIHIHIYIYINIHIHVHVHVHVHIHIHIHYMGAFSALGGPDCKLEFGVFWLVGGFGFSGAVARGKQFKSAQFLSCQGCGLGFDAAAVWYSCHVHMVQPLDSSYFSPSR